MVWAGNPQKLCETFKDHNHLLLEPEGAAQTVPKEALPGEGGARSLTHTEREVYFRELSGSFLTKIGAQ